MKLLFSIVSRTSLLSLLLNGTLFALRAEDLSSAPTNEVQVIPEVGSDCHEVTNAIVPSKRMLPEKEVIELLTTALQDGYVKEKGDLELRLTRAWTPLQVPGGPIKAKILELPNAGITPSFIVRFELQTPQATLGTWQVPVQARIFREIWVARSALKRGEPLNEAELARERRDVLTCREQLADFADSNASLEMAEPLQTGLPLLARSIKVRPVIHRGQTTAAMLQDGGLMITMKVEVLEDGAPGEVVRARNPVSRRDIRGRVVSDHLLLVCL